jgi:hypothetical protein
VNIDDRAGPEEELQETAQRLGTKAAETIDVERTVQGVLKRLREEPVVRRRWWAPRPAWLRLAATVALLVAGTLLVLRSRPRGERVNEVVAVATDLGELSSGQLQELLGSMNNALDDAVVDIDSDLETLTEEQLRTLMQSLGG